MTRTLQDSRSLLREYRLRSERGTSPSASSVVEALAAPFVEELAAAWHSGKKTLVEDLLTAHPELRDQPETALRIIYEEVCLRQEAGEEVTTAEVVRRFPEWQDELEALFDCYRLMQPQAQPAFPEIGSVLGDFRFLAQLGQGARGRVYLAVQCSLADRPLVIKVTPLAGREHLTLARLQHTHIVPLYQVQEFSEQRLLLLCMPHLGGTNLARLLKALAAHPAERRTGRQILDVLDEAQCSSPIAVPCTGSSRKVLTQVSYVEAICWIGACLADALQYAHDRGLVHLDLKPANILLAADGQPMLLDFHLARAPVRPDGPTPDWLGGTPEYMSPEQQAALAAVRTSSPIPAAVDGRSDVYSLGALLHEALSGAPASAQAESVRLDRCNPAVSVGLADIIQRCLAAEPTDRYADAAALAHDLRNHLADLPLRGVRNRSIKERWRKWRRRRPHVLALTAMLLVALGAIVGAALAVRSRLDSAREARLRETERAVRAALVNGQEQLRSRHPGEALQTLRHGLTLARNLPDSQDLARSLADWSELAERADKAHGLNQLVEYLRFLEAADGPNPGAHLDSLDTQCHAVWEQRNALLGQPGMKLDADLEKAIQVDLLDLALLWANLHHRVAPGNRIAESTRESLQILEQAEALFGPSAVLCRERQTLAEALGVSAAARPASAPARETSPRTSWEHDALGRILLRSGDVAAAAREFQQAVDLRPEDFWPNFHQGIAAYRLRRFPQAAAAFQVCVALAPRCPECFYNRALAWAELGDADQAFLDYNRALELDPRMAAAALNRGLLHYRQRHYAEASADLLRALDTGADPATVYYNLALLHIAGKNNQAALASLERALKQKPGHAEAKELHSRLQRTLGRAGQ